MQNVYDVPQEILEELDACACMCGLSAGGGGGGGGGNPVKPY